jgi:ketosteroid isomerase-like protein
VRPGHELQFAAMVERGVSQARAIFAFNSTNVEGWGLYSEFIMKPFMPMEGQLISLQHRLMRAARAYLDPELHMGKITPEQAMRVLREDVMLSEAMANQEVERYTFRMPAQATSYFYGYTRLSELRADTERELGAKFDQQKFHDFILGQGLLPPALLRKAVFADFIGKPVDRAAATRPDEQAIQHLIATYATSIDKADSEMADQIWSNAPEVSFIHPRGEAHGRAQIEADVYRNLMGGTFSERKLMPKDIAVQVYGDTGWSEFHWEFVAKVRKDGSALHTQGRETQIYHKENGQWRIVHVHYSGSPVGGNLTGF